MILHKTDVDDLARALTTPFSMQLVAEVDHFGVYLYLSSGAVQRHVHVTQDELFYVHDGVLSLDTDWGPVLLRPHEFAVVPRGVSHASGSLARTTVLLFQARGDPDRKNGHGRLSAEGGMDHLPSWSVRAQAAAGAGAGAPFATRPLATVDEMSLRVARAEGATPWHRHDLHDEMVYVVEGQVALGSEIGPLLVRAGELVVLPRGRIHRLVAAEPGIVVTLIHGEVPPEEQMGRQEE